MVVDHPTVTAGATMIPNYWKDLKTAPYGIAFLGAEDLRVEAVPEEGVVAIPVTEMTTTRMTSTRTVNQVVEAVPGSGRRRRKRRRTRSARRER